MMMNIINLNVDKQRKERAVELLTQQYPGESLERLIWMAVMQVAESGEGFEEEPERKSMFHYFDQLA